MNAAAPPPRSLAALVQWTSEAPSSYKDPSSCKARPRASTPILVQDLAPVQKHQPQGRNPSCKIPSLCKDPPHPRGKPGSPARLQLPKPPSSCEPPPRPRAKPHTQGPPLSSPTSLLFLPCPHHFFLETPTVRPRRPVVLVCWPRTRSLGGGGGVTRQEGHVTSVTSLPLCVPCPQIPPLHPQKCPSPPQVGGHTTRQRCQGPHPP